MLISNPAANAVRGRGRLRKGGWRSRGRPKSRTNFWRRSAGKSTSGWGPPYAPGIHCARGVPAAATAALVLGLTMFHRNEPLHPRYDEQFYAEISSLDQNPAPRAIQPIESLVEDDTQE